MSIGLFKQIGLNSTWGGGGNIRQCSGNPQRCRSRGCGVRFCFSPERLVATSMATYKRQKEKISTFFAFDATMPSGGKTFIFFPFDVASRNSMSSTRKVVNNSEYL